MLRPRLHRGMPDRGRRLGIGFPRFRDGVQVIKPSPPGERHQNHLPVGRSDCGGRARRQVNQRAFTSSAPVNPAFKPRFGVGGDGFGFVRADDQEIRGDCMMRGGPGHVRVLQKVGSPPVEIQFDAFPKQADETITGAQGTGAGADVVIKHDHGATFRRAGSGSGFDGSIHGLLRPRAGSSRTTGCDAGSRALDLICAEVRQMQASFGTDYSPRLRVKAVQAARSHPPSACS